MCIRDSYRGGGGYDNPYWLINNALRDETANRIFGSFKSDYNMNNWFNASLIIGADFTSDIRKQNFERGSRTRSTGAASLTQYTTYLYDAIINITGGDEIAPELNFN